MTGYQPSERPEDIADQGDRGALVLDRQQQTLVEVLTARNPEATTIYLGALRVLADRSNPDRLALGAHGIRELINLIPAFFELPIEQKDDSLGNKVQVLHDAWRREQKKPRQPGEAFSSKFVQKLEDFFAWHTKHTPKQKERAAAMLTHLDPAKRPLPAPIQELRVEQWRNTLDFFNRAAHHGGCKEDELGSWLDSLEAFLLDLVKPRFFDNADTIDALIAEVEDA